MPILENQRHEFFAQGMAKGQNATEAYLAAGYKCSEAAACSSASELLRNPKIEARVTELRERVAEKVNYDLAWFLEKGAELLKAATDAGDHSAASAQYQRLATVAGQWVEQSKTQNQTLVRDIRDQPLSTQEWAEQHATH